MLVCTASKRYSENLKIFTGGITDQYISSDATEENNGEL